MIWCVALRRLEVGAERPALDRLGEDHGGRAFVLDRGLVRRVELAVVVPAARQLLQLVVAQVLDHLAQPRVGAEEVLADVRARLDRVLLEVAVERRVHLVDEHAVDVAGEQVVPGARPRSTLMTFQPMPRNIDSNSWITLPLPRTGPSRRCRLQLTTKIRLSRLLARREAQRGDRLGLVDLAVADEAPHPRVRRVDELRL